MYIDENGLAEFTTKMKTYIDNKFAPEPQEEYFLTFSSPNSFTISTLNGSKNWDGTLEYSTDKETWNTWAGGTASSSLDGKLYIRGIGNTKITGTGTNVQWTSQLGANISISGNIETLLDYATVKNGQHPAMATYCFRRWMYQNTKITDCSNLVLGAETLTDYCYATMFSGCSNLTEAPSISAITLASNCCNSMFYNCTSLTTAPQLPATTLASYCYSTMFSGCTSLTTAPQLPATTLAYYCYDRMFSGCTSLTTVPQLPATTLASYCYEYMFSGCTNLITLPKLPATTLAYYCYQYMFAYCTKIKISSTQTSEYVNEYRIPTTGTGTTAGDWNIGMFASTGGTFTSYPQINTTYYTSNDVV